MCLTFFCLLGDLLIAALWLIVIVVAWGVISAVDEMREPRPRPNRKRVTPDTP